MGKGADFERNTCRELSEWWSEGIGEEVTDDYFWRSSQSGGRATQRAKSGKKTFGSYGDITALNPLGAPLIKYFTIELKRGYADCHPADLIDGKDTTKVRPFEKFLEQAIRSAEQAGSRSWLLVCKQDRRKTMVYLPRPAWKSLSGNALAPVTYALWPNFKSKENRRCVFVGMTLPHFKQAVLPAKVLEDLANTD